MSASTPRLFPEHPVKVLEELYLHTQAMLRVAACEVLGVKDEAPHSEAIIAKIDEWFGQSADDATKAFQVRADRAQLMQFQGKPQ